MRKVLSATIVALSLMASLTGCGDRIVDPQTQLDQLVAAKGDQLVSLTVDIIGKDRIPDLTIGVVEGDRVADYLVQDGEVTPNGSAPISPMDTPTRVSEFDLADLIARAEQLSTDEACAFRSMTATPTPIGMAIHPHCAGIDGGAISRDQLATLNNQPAFIPATPMDDATALVAAGTEIAKVTGSTDALEIHFLFDHHQISVLSPATYPGLDTPCTTETRFYDDEPSSTVPPGCDTTPNLLNHPTFRLDEPTMTAIVEASHTIRAFPITGIQSIAFEATDNAIRWSVTSQNVGELINHPEYASGTIPRP